MPVSKAIITRVAIGGVLLGLIAVGAYAYGAAVHTGPAFATWPTTGPWDVEWEVTAPEKAIAGEPMTVSVAVGLTPGINAQGAPRLPVFHFAPAGDSPMLELLSASEVTPDDVDEGAAWELLPLRDGETSFEVSLTYTVSWCFPCGEKTHTHTTSQPIIVHALPGDSNCDGTIGVVDAALVLQFDAHLLDELPCAAGDVNDDGATDVVDATLILQYVVGLLAGL